MTRPPPDPQLAAVLVDAAVAGRAPTAILEALCRALVDTGMPLSRATAGAFLIHPLLDATLVIWRADRGAYLDDTPRPTVRGNEAWRPSPFYRMEQEGSNLLRRRLERGEGADEFAVLADLAAEGATDYLALRTRLAAGVTLGAGTSIFSSWITRRAGGFTPGELDRIAGIEPLLAVVLAAALGTATAGTLLATYLGADAASRVLGGDVERGKVEMIHAVIWYSDLAGFTRLVDQVSGGGMLQLFTGHAEILGLLNDHAEALVDAIEGQGGQVLKFMGDGLLAIFRAATEARCLRGGPGRLGRRGSALRPARPPPHRGDTSLPRPARGRGPLWQYRRPRPARLHRARAGGERGQPHRRPLPPAGPDRDHVRGVRRVLPVPTARRSARSGALCTAWGRAAADAVRVGGAGRGGFHTARLTGRAQAWAVFPPVAAFTTWTRLSE